MVADAVSFNQKTRSVETTGLVYCGEMIEDWAKRKSLGSGDPGALIGSLPNRSADPCP